VILQPFKYTATKYRPLYGMLRVRLHYHVNKFG